MKNNKKNKEFFFKVKNKKWKLVFVKSKEMPKSWGEADYPNVKNPKIWINKNMNERNTINTIIHEVLHAVRPELSEESVVETADVLTVALRKSGLKIKNINANMTKR